MLVSQLFDIYVQAEPVMRRRINQASWDGFDVDAEGVVGARLSDPMAALVAADVMSSLGATNENRDLCESGRGSRLNVLVDLSGLEPPTSTLRTCLLRISGDSRELSGQLSELSTRRRTAMNGGVRGMAAG
jgi:hypothetical protein